jgi:hypothetical protein
MLVRAGNASTARKGRGDILDSLSGGSSYQRFSQCVIWLKKLKKFEDLMTKDSVGTEDRSCNYIVQIAKARRGSGSGSELGFVFQGLRFEERGVIVQ